VESPGRKELGQDQLLEQDLVAKVVSSFADHALCKGSKDAAAEAFGVQARIGILLGG
jgi:hypothetical protein